MGIPNNNSHKVIRQKITIATKPIRNIFKLLPGHELDPLTLKIELEVRNKSID